MNIRKNIVSFLVGFGAITLLAIIFLVPVLFLLGVANSMSEGCVAEVEITGEITTDELPASIFSEGIAGSKTIAKTIRSLDDRPDVKGVIFVINSPGGGVVASKEIYEAVEDLEKPKVAYFREVAASGGYHIATPTDWIVSEPGALTGNVGARMELIQVVGLMDMLGINTTTFKSGENKDMGSAFRDLTDEEKIILESIVNESFEDFKMSVIRDRGTKLRNTDEIFDGRIMSGRQAYEYGLVDEIGNRQKAIAKAGELSGLGEDPKICKISLTSSMGEGGLFMEFVMRFAEGIGYGFSRGLQENKVKSVKLSYE